MKYTRALMLGVATSFALSAGALAAELNTPYAAPYSSGYGFEGFYAGVLVGGFFDGSSAYLTAPDTSAISAGLAVGVNFYLTDSVVGGLEVQASADMGATATISDAFVLGKLGFAPSDDVMVYGTGGAGWVGGSTAYAVGGGVEMAVMDSMGVRGEVLAVGPWGASPNAYKATAGLVWRMQ